MKAFHAKLFLGAFQVKRLKMWFVLRVCVDPVGLGLKDLFLPEHERVRQILWQSTH